MFRLLILALIVGLFVWAWLRIMRNEAIRRQSNLGAGGQVQATVCCAHCQLFVAKDEAVTGGTNHFCSLEHKQAFDLGHPQS